MKNRSSCQFAASLKWRFAEKKRRGEAGFIPSFTIEFLVVATLLALFIAMALPTYAAVRQHGSGVIPAAGIGIAAGLCLDFLFFAVPFGLVRWLVWRDTRKLRPKSLTHPGNTRST